MTKPAETGAVELVPFDELESRRQLWEALAARSRNVFASWEWASVWWRHFGAGTEPVFVECRRPSGEPFAILPLHAVRRGPLRILRLIGHGVGDVLGPVCDPADAGSAGAALRTVASRLPDPSPLLVAERLPAPVLSNACGGRLLLREANPSLAIEGRGWEEYVASRSRNLREKIRRSARKVERQHDVVYTLCERPEDLDTAIDLLFQLHKARWGEQTTFTQDANVRFHRDLAAALLSIGRLRLWTMSLDGEPVAAWYGYRYEGVEAYYQSGRDPSRDKLAVGFLMLIRTLRAAFDDGLQRYAFLRGNEPYKDRFADSDDGLETRAVGTGPMGTTLVAGAAVAQMVPPLRRVLARRVL